MRKLVTRFAEEALQFDTRLQRTLRRAMRPGALTNDYIAGRRASFTHPLRLLLLGGFVFLLALSAGSEVLPENKGFVVQLEDGMEARMEEGRDSLRQDDTLLSQAKAYYLSGVLKGHRNPNQVSRLFIDGLSFAAIVLLPLFGLLLRGLFRKRLYVEHIVFTLHLHAVLFGGVGLAVFVVLLLQTIGVPDAVSTKLLGFAGLGLMAYTWVALRRVYGSGIVQTTVKFIALAAVYSIVFSFVIAIYSIVTTLRM